MMHYQWDQLMAEFSHMSDLNQRRTINKAQMEWLAEIAATVPSKYALDLGFGCGFSAMVMAQGGCTVTCVNYEDVHTPRRVEAEKRYKRVCGREPHIINAPTDRALPKLQDEEKSFGLIFVDAGHRFDDVFIDIHYATRLCVPDGILTLDDTYYGAIKCVANWINTNLQHIWEPYQILENTMSWKQTKTDVNDSTQRIIHRTHAGPPKYFEISTENAYTYPHFPGENEAKQYGFEIWNPNLS